MKKLIIPALIFIAALGAAYAWAGLRMDMTMRVGGPATASGTAHFSEIDNAGNYLIIDGAGHKLEIDGAG
jgi:hypothetical protein